MENQTQQGYGMQVQQPLPNSTAVLVLGIVSIIGCFCYGIVGTVCGIIALVLASKSKKLYEANPEAYTVSSFKNMNAGRICAIIGLILSIIYLALVIFGISIIGMEALKNPQNFMNR
jgi:hypothetical protein